MNQFIRFGIVGTVGFFIDSSVLLFFVHVIEYPIPIARFFSFSVAVFFTWLINRNFTFSKNCTFNKRKEYLIYFIIQTIGALINYVIFIILVYKFEFMKTYLVLPLAFAAVIAMFFNFFTLRKYIYNK